MNPRFRQQAFIWTLEAEILDLKSRADKWKEAWHHCRLLIGKNFWMEPYRMEKESQ